MAVVDGGGNTRVCMGDDGDGFAVGDTIMRSMSWFFGAVTIAIILLIYWGTR